MNKQGLVAAIAERAGLSKRDAEKAVDAFVQEVENALRDDERVQLMGFGTFEIKERAARKGRNPHTQEEIDIPATRAPVFKAGKALKTAVMK